MSKMIIRPLVMPLERTTVIDLRVALKGRIGSVPQDLQDAINLIRTYGACEIMRSGVLHVGWEDLKIHELRDAKWFDDESK